MDIKLLLQNFLQKCLKCKNGIFLRNAQFFSEKIHLLFGTLLGKCAALLAGNLQKIVFVSCQFYADQQNFIKCVVVMRTTSENNPTKFHNNNNIPSEFRRIAVFVSGRF